MSDHTPSFRRRNKFTAACLSLALLAGVPVVTTASAPVALAQSSEHVIVLADDGDGGEVQETSSWETSSIATDEGSFLEKATNVLSLIVAVSGVVGIFSALIMHFGNMLLPSVPWSK